MKNLLFNADLNSELYNYNTMVLPKSPKSILFNPYSLNPSMIDLPKNYLDFISLYFKETCTVCKAIPSHGQTALCLLCKEVFCVGKCTSKDILEDNSHFSIEGNLFKHAKKKHCGNGIYLEISSLSFMLTYNNRSL